MSVSKDSERSNGLSRMKGWRVWNFMSIEYGQADFDDRGIINFKGYNDSGKSTMIRALDVLLSNIKPTMQTSFIQDDKDYFRIVAEFDDGVSIMRDKYINGQSLYEMYKDGECIFSTKRGKVLTKITGVPEPIAEYLALASYDGIVLNSRSCFDKQLLVQTTGSENYKFLNKVLKSEEIAVASEMINADKNKLLSDITSTETELGIYKQQTEGAEGITKPMVDMLKTIDVRLDTYDEQIDDLSAIVSVYDDMVAIPNYPEMSEIDDDKAVMLSQLISLTEAIDNVAVPPQIDTIEGDKLADLLDIMDIEGNMSAITVPPEIGEIDDARVTELGDIISMQKAISGITVAPAVSEVGAEQLVDLIDVVTKYNAYTDVANKVTCLEADLDSLDRECSELEQAMVQYNKSFVRCPNCGTLVEVGAGHTD